jgi:hypothetical protein
MHGPLRRQVVGRLYVHERAIHVTAKNGERRRISIIAGGLPVPFGAVRVDTVPSSHFAVRLAASRPWDKGTVPARPSGRPAVRSGCSSRAVPQGRTGTVPLSCPRPGVHGPHGQDCGTVPICPAAGRITWRRGTPVPMRAVRLEQPGDGATCPNRPGRDVWGQSLRPVLLFDLPFCPLRD